MVLTHGGQVGEGAFYSPQQQVFFAPQQQRAYSQPQQPEQQQFFVPAATVAALQAGSGPILANGRAVPQAPQAAPSKNYEPEKD